MSDSQKRTYAVHGLVGMSVFVAALTFWTYPGLKTLQTPELISTAAYQALLLLAVWVMAVGDGLGVRSLNPGQKWNKKDALWMGALVLLSCAFSGGFVYLLRSFLPKLDEREWVVGLTRELGALEPVALGVVTLGLVLLVGASEELVFRSYLVTRLRHCGFPVWPSIVLSALFFGLLHAPDFGLLLAIEKGVFWGIPAGYFFHRRGSILPLIAAHAFVDALALTLTYLAVRHQETH